MFGPSSRASSAGPVAWRTLRSNLRRRRRPLALIVASFSLGALIPGMASASSHIAARDKVVKKPHICSEVGCTSGVTVYFSKLQSTLPDARSVTLCVANRCVSESSPRSEFVVFRWRDTPTLNTKPLNVLVLVRDQKHGVLLSLHRRVILKRTRPNGAHCPPTCFDAALVLNAKHRQLDLIHRP